MCFAGRGPRTDDFHGDWWWTEEQADYSNECKITLMLIVKWPCHQAKLHASPAQETQRGDDQTRKFAISA